VGVQWHPERMLGEGGQVRIFAALVEAAGGRRR
jgi:gamma-glutamyl-gamma-aminobutyrate hydrolase PuuD